MLLPGIQIDEAPGDCRAAGRAYERVRFHFLVLIACSLFTHLSMRMWLRRLVLLRNECAIQFEVVKLILYVPVGHQFLADERSFCLRLISGVRAMRRR